MIAKVLEQHNRDQFDVFGYSVHGASSCEMRQRIEKSFDKFKDVQSMSDKEIALEVRRDKIDIAVDLNKKECLSFLSIIKTILILKYFY